MKTKRVVSSLFFIFLVVISVRCATQTVKPPSTESVESPAIRDFEETLILISIDGFASDYFKKAPLKNINSIIDRGVRAKGLIPVFPTLTFPNHYTAVTGLMPTKHGIIANEMIDANVEKPFSLKDRETLVNPIWWLGEPIWISAKKSGLISATMFWPGSEVEISGARPDYFRNFDPSVTRMARVDQILEWLDLPSEQRPRVLTLYFEDVDSAGHKFGPQSPEVVVALESVDQTIGVLLSGLVKREIYQKTNIVIISDHGMASVDERKIVSIKEMTLPEQGRWVGGGALAGFHPSATLSEPDLDKLLRKLDSLPHSQAYKRQSIPKKLNYSDSARIPPLVLLADLGAYISRFDTAPGKGAHGYAQKFREMEGIFIAAGPSFPNQAQVPSFSILHVYSVLCKAMELKCNEGDGDWTKTRLDLK